MSVLLLLCLLGGSIATNIRISAYPGNNLWQGESIILQCRVQSGITRYTRKLVSGSITELRETVYGLGSRRGGGGEKVFCFLM